MLFPILQMRKLKLRRNNMSKITQLVHVKLLIFEPIEFHAAFLMDELYNNSVKSPQNTLSIHLRSFFEGGSSLGLVPKNILSIKNGALCYC